MHYHRALIDGELYQHPRSIPEYGSDFERFFAKVQITGFCWEWMARLNNRGYPCFDTRGRAGRPVYAHRFVYELMVGPIPDGLTIDHLSFNPRCVNPDHLEPVTLAENSRRRDVRLGRGRRAD